MFAKITTEKHPTLAARKYLKGRLYIQFLLIQLSTAEFIMLSFILWAAFCMYRKDNLLYATAFWLPLTSAAPRAAIELWWSSVAITSIAALISGNIRLRQNALLYAGASWFGTAALIVVSFHDTIVTGFGIVFGVSCLFIALRLAAPKGLEWLSEIRAL